MVPFDHKVMDLLYLLLLMQVCSDLLLSFLRQSLFVQHCLLQLGRVQMWAWILRWSLRLFNRRDWRSFGNLRDPVRGESSWYFISLQEVLLRLLLADDLCHFLPENWIKVLLLRFVKATLLIVLRTSLRLRNKNLFTFRPLWMQLSVEWQPLLIFNLYHLLLRL